MWLFCQRLLCTGVSSADEGRTGVIAVEYSRQTDEVYGHSKLSIGLNI